MMKNSMFVSNNEAVNPSHQQAMANLDLISEVLATNKAVRSCSFLEERRAEAIYAPLPPQDSGRKFQRRRTCTMQQKIHCEYKQGGHIEKRKRRIYP